MRKIRSFLYSFLYHLLVFLRMPVAWQAYLLPKHFFLGRVYTVDINRIRAYSTSDPEPPKHSVRFCFKSSEERKMYPIASIFTEMTDANSRSCVHNTVRDMFILQKDYRSTSQYQRMVRSVSEGVKLYQCRSIEDVDLYFERLTQVYAAIKEDGYKTQQELGLNSRGEIRIHITNNGSLCLGSKGNHRFRIAELLDIKQIPCIIYGVNINWIIDLSKKTQLPPHQALSSWMKDPKFQD